MCSKAKRNAIMVLPGVLLDGLQMLTSVKAQLAFAAAAQFDDVVSKVTPWQTEQPQPSSGSSFVNQMMELKVKGTLTANGHKEQLGVSINKASAPKRTSCVQSQAADAAAPSARGGKGKRTKRFWVQIAAASNAREATSSTAGSRRETNR